MKIQATSWQVICHRMVIIFVSLIITILYIDSVSNNDFLYIDSVK